MYIYRVLDTFLSLKIREIDMGDGREDRTVESKAARRERLRKNVKKGQKGVTNKFLILICGGSKVDHFNLEYIYRKRNACQSKTCS